MRRLEALPLAVLAFCFLPLPATAQDTPAAEEAAPEEPTWTAKLGLSYLATSGNSDTETLGFDVEAVKRPDPWGLEITAQFNQAEQDGEKTAERYHAGLRATRAWTERWDAFVGLSAEQDEFAGIDLRGVVEAGAVYKALRGPRHTLDLDVALTWTDEERLPPAVDESWLGALLGADYDFAISENATFSQHLRYFPNLDDGSDWRADSVTALTAAVNQHLAVRLSHEIRYRNRPIGDNDDTDTTSKVSLVWSR
jgi:putative salt-induced outer membrane protein